MSVPGAWRPRGGAPSPVPLRWRLARLGVFALAIVGALLGTAVLWYHATVDPLVDVRAYYDAASRLNAGEPLYPSGADPNVADFYRYPPLLAIVLRPFALLPFHVAAVLWGAAMVGCLLLTIRRLGGGRRAWLGAALLGVPIGWALAIGQAHLLVVLLVAVGQPWSIALATNIELFPALVAVWWIGRRDWGAVAAFVAWMVVLTLGQWLLEPAGSAAFPGTLTLEHVGEVASLSPFELSPEVWLVLLGLGAVVAVALAPTRWGWPAAVTLATLASPRLLLYVLTELLATVREPGPPRGEVDADGGVPDAAIAVVRASR